MIVDVKCEDDTIQIAKIIREDGDTYDVNFLEPKRQGVYDFSSNVETIPKDTVSGFYDVNNLEDTGLYYRSGNGYELVDDSEDEDYTCSDSEESESDEDDESLVDEEEDEEGA
ncbi:hypothetical protein OtV6_021c [Ostreococcus tauri virus RT-2011]|nr:hypothetical protein OtV6_021c [Ostreococcus tauri virus RT-2011]